MIGDDFDMVEVIEKNTGTKMMAVMFGKLMYQEESYAIYCIRRGKEDANIFVSRLLKTSEGLALDDDFVNGEKEVIEGIIKKLLSKISLLELEQDGFSLSKEIDLSEGLSFDSKKCYVTTVPRNLIKECMIEYQLVTESIFEVPLVEVQEEKLLNKGFISNVILIVFGIVVIIFCLVVVGGVLFGS